MATRCTNSGYSATSSVNFAAGQDIAGTTVVGCGPSATIQILSNTVTNFLVDVIGYYRGPDANNYNNSSDSYIIDIIGGHCGSTPSSIWSDVTDVTYESGTLGRVMYPRPGRVVAPCTADAK